jgi:hypothetical protein
MKSKSALQRAPDIESCIRTIRGQKVILDADLALIYGVATKRLNEQIQRNDHRFPLDFMFRLTPDEWLQARSQLVANESREPDRSQFATGSGKHRDPRFRPFAFTEHGALMAATVLHSPKAVKMSLFIIRAFVRMRENLAANTAILKRLAEIDRTLLTHDVALRDIYLKLRPLLTPAPVPARPEIGYHTIKK